MQQVLPSAQRDMPPNNIDIEALLDRNPLSRLQKLVLGLCAVAAFIDGADRQSIGVIAHSLMQELHLSATQLGFIFSLDNLGAVVGAIVCGWLSDQFGRKPIMLASIAIMAIFTGLTAFSYSFHTLAIVRFGAGFGLGGAAPCFITLASEYVPKRMRSTTAAIIFAAYPLGAACGGFLNSYVITHYDWPVVFYIGTILPLILLAVAAPAMPESMQFLLSHAAPEKRMLKIARALDRSLAGAALRFTRPHQDEPARVRSGSTRALFGDGLARQTLCLWGIFFFAYATSKILSFWLPNILTSGGLPPSSSAIVQGCYNTGNFIGMIAAGRLIEKLGARRALAPALLVTAAAMAIVGLYPTNLTALLIVITVGGCSLGISMAGVVSITAGLYPTSLRATGMGAGMASSRFGQVVAPLGIALLVDMALDTQQIMLAVAAVPLCAFLMVLWFARAKHREAAMPQA